MNNDITTTLLQIDMQNLFYEARNRGQRLDLEKIWSYFHERETEFLTEAIIYIIRSDDFDSSKFEAKLKTIGYTIRTKNAVKITRNDRSFYRQTNHDVGITVECIDRINNFKKWILMSGDGDFIELCRYLKQKNKKIEIWSFKECYNHHLAMYADKVYFIDESFFLKRPKVTVFGFNLNDTESINPSIENHS